MEPDGDDFGPLYSDHVLKPSSLVEQAHFSNDHNPSDYGSSSDFSANVYKDLQDYDRFLLSECGVASECEVAAQGRVDEVAAQGRVDDEFNDVIFDVEMEQREVEFDTEVLDVEGQNNNMVDENEVDVVGEMMDQGKDVLEVYAGIPDSFVMMRTDNEDGVDNLDALTTDDSSVNEEDRERDESFDIIIDDSGLNDDCVESDKKEVEFKEPSLIKGNYIPEHLDDLETGEIDGMKAELVNNVEARVEHPNQSFHAPSKGVRSVFTSQTIDVDSKGEQNQVKPVHTEADKCGVARSRYIHNQVNPVCNAANNHGITRFRHLPASFKKAFNIEDDYSGYKPWTRPGVNLSDFFNFDLDEENWQNYCKQMKLLLQTSPPFKAVGNKSEQLQPIGEAIQVQISSGERVTCLENHHQRERDSDAIIEIGEATQVHISSGERVSCPENYHQRERDSDAIIEIGEAIQVHISSGERVSSLEHHRQRERNSDAIIEIVCVDSTDDTESFTKDLRDCALHEYKTRPTTIHKIINGDKILPFPLDGYFHQISHEERTSHRVTMNYAQEGRQWTYFESMISKKKDRIHNQERSMHLDHPKDWTEAEQRLRKELVKCDKVMPLYHNKDVSKNDEGQTTAQNRLEDNRFHNSGKKSWRQGDSNHRRSLKRPDESKLTANVYVKKRRTDNGFDRTRMSIEENLSQTDYQGGSNEKLNKGCAVDKENGVNGMRTEETLSQKDHQEENYENKLNKGSVSTVEEDNYRMKIEETLSQTHQEGNNDNKLNKGSAFDRVDCRMRIEETLTQSDDQDGNDDKKFNMGSASDKDNCRMRIEETLSQADHQEGNNNKMLNLGSAVDEDIYRMRIEETLSQVDQREGNDDKKFDMGFAVHEDNSGMIIEETLSQIDYQEGNNDKKLNMGSAVDEDIGRVRIEEIFSRTDHQANNDDNNLNTGFAVHDDNCRIIIEETLSQTDHQERNNDKKLNMGSMIDEDICSMRIEETLSQTDHQAKNDDKKLNMGFSVCQDNCTMIIEEMLSQTDLQEGNNEKKLNTGSVVDEAICRMRIEEILSQTDYQAKNDDKNVNKGSAVDKDNCKIRIEETVSQTDHHEGINDNKLNMGSAIDEDIFRMRIEENLSQTDHQEGNDDKRLNMGIAVGDKHCRMRTEETLLQTDQQEENNKLNKESTVDEDFNSTQATEQIDNHEQEFPNNCNLANKLGNNVIFDDQKHEAKRGKNVDEESKKMHGSPQARESSGDDMKQLMSNIKGLMSEIDELVGRHEHEHRICCLR